MRPEAGAELSPARFPALSSRQSVAVEPRRTCTLPPGVTGAKKKSEEPGGRCVVCHGCFQGVRPTVYRSHTQVVKV